MKSLARLVLRFFIVAIPVVIAACYGMAYRFTKRGRVIDQATRTGIENVTVTCDVAKQATYHAYSSADGSFYLQYDTPCDTVTAGDDVRYVKKAVPFDAAATEIVIELVRK